MVDPLRKSVHWNCKLGHNDWLKFRTFTASITTLAGSGVGVIMHHLAGELSRSLVEVEALASSGAVNFSKEGVTPAMGTYRGTSVADDLTASVIDVVASEGMEGHAWGE